VTGRRRAARRGAARPRASRVVAALVAVAGVAAVALIVTLNRDLSGGQGGPPAHAYIGVYAPPSPASYAGVSQFTAATGVRPGLVAYYSAWDEPFRAGFAAAAARHHALPLVQIDPAGVSLAAIARGRYDGYLRSYARSVAGVGPRVVLSFGPEIKGTGYSWA
jgi:hypothetical protein